MDTDRVDRPDTPETEDARTVGQTKYFATKEDVLLTPILSQTPTFSEWTFSDVSDGITNIQQPVFTPSTGDEPFWSVNFGYDGETRTATVFSNDKDATNLAFEYSDEGLNLHLTATRTRTDIVGYTLGDQETKPLQPKGDYISPTNISSQLRTSLQNMTALQSTDDPATIRDHVNTLMNILKAIIPAASVFAFATPLFGVTILDNLALTNEVYTAGEVNELVYTQALSRAEAEIGYTDWKVTSTNAEIISSSVNWQQEPPSWVIDVTTLEDGAEKQYSYTNSPSTGLETEITFIVESSEPAPPVNPKTVVTFEDGTSQEYDWSGKINQQTMINAGLFDEDEGMWTINISNVIIGTNVTSIRDWAFSRCSGLTSVMIPDSVTNIGDWAFSSCSGLTSVTIPDSVTSIGDSAFYSCSGLTSVTIPDSVTSIERRAFAYCSSLTTITCSVSTAPIVQSETFGGDAESYTGRNTYNTGINKLIVPQGATGYNTSYWLDPLCNSEKCGFTLEYSSNIREPLTARTSGAYTFTATRIRLRPTPEMEEFWNANIEALQFKEWYPDGSITNKNQWTTGLNYTFDSTNKTAEVIQNSNITGSVVIPPYVDYDNERYVVTSIGSTAFSRCSGLTSVMIPDSVTNIGNAVFYYCSSLTSVTIGNGVTSIGASAFADCSGLTSVTIPDSVTSIGASAFADCSGLTSVTIPNSVTSIGGYAFFYCSGLKSVTIGNSVTSIGDDAFSGCSGLTSVTIPNSVTIIESSAFDDCSGLTSVTIPDSVTSIGSYAFSGCTKLSEVNFGSKEFQSIPTLPYINAFSTLSGRTCRIIVPDDNYSAWVTNQNWAALTAKGYAFIKYSDWEAPRRYELNPLASTNYVNEAVGSLVIPTLNGNIYDMSTNEGYFRAIEDVVRILGGVVTNGLPEPAPPANPKTVVTFEDGTSQEYDWSGEINQGTMINEGWFDPNEWMWTTSITNVVIGTNVTSIGDHAFDTCNGLTSVTIPDSVTSIGDHAFSYCSSLTSVTIGDSVTSIGDWTFWNCSGLKSVTIGNGVTNIEDWAFYGCSALTTITCNALTAPTVQSDTFGEDEDSWTGRNTYSSGTNKLIVPQGATGYTTGAWLDPLQDDISCGFTLEYAAQ